MYSDRQRPALQEDQNKTRTPVNATDQKFVGLYLFATIWITYWREPSFGEKTEVTPSVKWAFKWLNDAASSAALNRRSYC